MRFFLAIVVVLILLSQFPYHTNTYAQLPTFGPSCDEETPIPTQIPSSTPTSPPGLPTYTPAPTSIPQPTKVPCTPTIRPTGSGQGGQSTPIPTKPIPTKLPKPPPRSGTAETTLFFLGIAGFLMLSGTLGIVSFGPNKK